MGETITIIKNDEKAIISCLREASDRRLPPGEIIKYVKKYIKKEDGTIRKSIGRMVRKKLLLCQKYRSNKFLYYLDPEIDFDLEGPPLQPLIDHDEVLTAAQLEHSARLKDAVQTWMENLSEPTTETRLSSSIIIPACENHVLFPDLINHLPTLGSDILERWDEYKKHLAQLEELKQGLISLSGTEIQNCFEGIKLRFVSADALYTSDYECTLGPQSIYSIALALASGAAGYEDHQKLLSWLQNNAPIVEEGDQAIWGEVITYLRVPKKDRGLLEAGASRFISFFEDMPGSEYPAKAKEIIEMVASLKQARSEILSELERILCYSTYPGKCQYSP